MSRVKRILLELKKLPEIEGCPPQKLARFLPHITERKLNEGEWVFTPGERALNTFLVIEGQCQITTNSSEPINVEQGYIGEEAALGFPSYIGKCCALTDTTLLIFPRHALKSMIEYHPIHQGLKNSFSTRLAGIDRDSSVKSGVNTNRVCWKDLAGWLMALLAPLLVYFTMLTIPDLPDARAPLLLAILSISVVMWIFSLTPDFVPAILAVLCIILMGLAPPEVVLQGFSDNSFFMALGIFALSTVIMVSGLSYRVLLWLLKIGPAHKAWYSFSLFFTGLILTPLVPTTNGRVAIMGPFLKEMLTAFDEKSAQLEAPRLAASTLNGISLFSAIFMTSKSVNFIIYGLLPLQEQTRFQWLFWLLAASVCGASLLFGYLLTIWLVFRNNTKPVISKSMIVTQLKLLGPISTSEWACLTGLGVLLTSFLTSSVHHIAVSWVALSIMLGLLLFGFLSNEDFRKKIDWSFLVFLGSLIGIVATITHIGLETYLGEKLSWLGLYMEQSFERFVLFLALTIFVVRLLLPINATIVILATLLIPFAINYGINPWVVGFIILLLSESFFYPYQASYYSLFVSITGEKSKSEHPRVILSNVIIYLIKILAIYISLPFWRNLGLL